MAGQGIAYLPPTEQVPIFDSSLFLNNDFPLTYSEAIKLFLAYPYAQGLENLQAINVNGLSIFNEDSTFNGKINAQANININNIQNIDTGIYFSSDITENLSSILSNSDGDIQLTSPNIIESTAPTINLISSTITNVKTPNLDVFSPNSYTTYLQLIPTFSELTDSATLYFGSTTQNANSYIGINSLVNMAMAISSTGSIILNSAVDMVQLTNAPSGNVDAAIATVGYVNSGYIPIGDQFPSGFIGQSLRTGVNASPAGWLYCDGSQYPTTGIYANLYAVIGNSYGPPSFETFYVPNIDTQFIIASNNAGSNQLPISNIVNTTSQQGGSNTLNSSQLPAHTHTFGPIFNGSGGGGSYGQYVPDGKTPSGPVYYPSTGNAGSNSVFSPPYFAAHFMIKL